MLSISSWVSNTLFNLDFIVSHWHYWNFFKGFSDSAKFFLSKVSNVAVPQVIMWNTVPVGLMYNSVNRSVVKIIYVAFYDKQRGQLNPYLFPFGGPVCMKICFAFRIRGSLLKYFYRL